MQIIPVFGGPPTPKTLWWLTGFMLMLEGLAQLSDREWIGVLDLRGLMISYGAFWDFYSRLELFIKRYFLVSPTACC